MKERIIQYLKDEFGIETYEDFVKAVNEYPGVDISILAGGVKHGANKDKMEECG